MRRIIGLLAGAMIALCAVAPAFASKLYISEYPNLGFVGPAQTTAAMIAPEPSIVDQNPVDFTSGAAQSAAFNTKTRFVRVICDAQCSIKFGSSPTATNQNKPLAAMQAEYFAVIPGQKISVISNP